MVHLDLGPGSLFLICTNNSTEHTHDPGCVAGPYPVAISGIEFNSFTISDTDIYPDARITTMSLPEPYPDDYMEFLAHHESYDKYDRIARSLVHGYANSYHWYDTKHEYELWKNYPDRRELRPGRRILEGYVIKIDLEYDRFGVIRVTTLELLDHNLVILRMPKSASWEVGDLVEVAATVSCLESPHVGQGHNPRMAKPLKDTGSQLSVSDFLPS